MSDRRIFLAVVLFLGGTLLLTVGGIAVLAGVDRTIPGILENIAVGCLTGLAGLLARGPSSSEAQPVTVHQPAGQPVPTVEVPGDAGHLDITTVLGGIVIVALGLVVGSALLRLL